ncbi:class I SAM-dependent methyltransferase [Nocardia sputi]|uniref:class I SAM-dependent methyltransferase n=1 Tax=Nocardia sputi TaxID=2943705 RepID=UPI0027E2B959|nr:class I SAM-dependent methyltransferase [Nocardia sputi]
MRHAARLAKADGRDITWVEGDARFASAFIDRRFDIIITPSWGAMAFQPWEITDDYLGGGGSRTYDNAGSYTDNSDGQITHVTVYEWRYALSDVIGALLRAGLRIEAVAELPYMDWRGFPELVACP